MTLTLEVGRQDADSVAVLLRGLPDWFGIEEANARYVEAARTMPTVRALDGQDVAGVMLWHQHYPGAAEVHLMAVDAARHRTGVGTALLARAEEELRPAGVRYLQVKTLGPSQPDEEYAATHAFYEARGFVPIEEFIDFWDDEPMLLMVKAL